MCSCGSRSGCRCCGIGYGDDGCCFPHTVVAFAALFVCDDVVAVVSVIAVASVQLLLLLLLVYLNASQRSRNGLGMNRSVRCEV